MAHNQFSNMNPDAPSQRPPVPAAPPRRSLWGQPIGYVVAYGADTYGQHLLTHEEAEAHAANCGGNARAVLVCAAQGGAAATPAQRSTSHPWGEPNDDGEVSPQVIEQAQCMVENIRAAAKPVAWMVYTDALAAVPAAQPIPAHIVREAERAIAAAEKPEGMGTHDGKASIPASHLRYLLSAATGATGDAQA